MIAWLILTLALYGSVQSSVLVQQQQQTNVVYQQQQNMNQQGQPIYQCTCDYELAKRQAEQCKVRQAPGHYQYDFGNVTYQGNWYIVEATNYPYTCPVMLKQAIGENTGIKIFRLPDQNTCDVLVLTAIDCVLTDSSWVAYYSDGSVWYVTVIDANYSRWPKYYVSLNTNVNTGEQQLKVLSSEPYLEKEILLGLHYRLIALGYGNLEMLLAEVSQRNCCEDNCRFSQSPYYNTV